MSTNSYDVNSGLQLHNDTDNFVMFVHIDATIDVEVGSDFRK